MQNQGDEGGARDLLRDEREGDEEVLLNARQEARERALLELLRLEGSKVVDIPLLKHEHYKSFVGNDLYVKDLEGRDREDSSV